MTLWVKGETNSPWPKPASLRDKLRDRGWVEGCASCQGPDRKPGYPPHADCPDCVEGLVPPEGMVEAAAKGAYVEPVQVRDVLLAAARWEREQ